MVLAAVLWPARAIIFFETGDPSHNTAAPTGEFADSGWQWQGNWRGFAGTPVGTNWFLSAEHLGGQVGDEFLLDGQAYRTTAFFDDPETDLRLWRVCQPFPSFAPLYGGADEAGRVCLLFGRGFGRGGEVTLTNAAGSEVRGWYWGGGSGALRWGLNRIAGYEDLGTSARVLLRATFDQAGESDEAMLTGGDSGGGLFLLRAGRWELAGVGFAVDGPFSYSGEGPGFSAALFDRRGLYEQSADDWTPVEATPFPKPGALYATRVSARRAWIEEVVAAHPEPPSQPTLLVALAPEGPFVPSEASVDADLQEIRLSRPVVTTFFRLSACRSLRIVSVKTDGEEVVLRYE